MPEGSLAKLIGVPAAADMLGLAKRTIYVMVARGEIESCRVGKRVLIPLAEIDRFIDRRRVSGCPSVNLTERKLVGADPADDVKIGIRCVEGRFEVSILLTDATSVRLAHELMAALDAKGIAKRGQA